jgi:nitrate reductase beta subunit
MCYLNYNLDQALTDHVLLSHAQVGLLGEGISGLLALQAIASFEDRFVTAVIQGELCSLATQTAAKSLAITFFVQGTHCISEVHVQRVRNVTSLLHVDLQELL